MKLLFPVSSEGDVKEYGVRAETLVLLKVKVYLILAACKDEPDRPVAMSGSTDLK
ncbi:MAG: hypothetical protein M3Y24_11930 [Acidobacteriota bacterium]|nr:hypothetical protein [Acidobacteriota bacterium]